jgi:hypothetical protein
MGGATPGRATLSQLIACACLARLNDSRRCGKKLGRQALTDRTLCTLLSIDSHTDEIPPRVETVRVHWRELRADTYRVGDIRALRRSGRANGHRDPSRSCKGDDDSDRGGSGSAAVVASSPTSPAASRTPAGRNDRPPRTFTLKLPRVPTVSARAKKSADRREPATRV